MLPEPLAVAVRDRVAFGHALGALGRYSLGTVAGDALRLHRLVQAVTRHALAEDEQRQWPRSPSAWSLPPSPTAPTTPRPGRQRLAVVVAALENRQ